MYSLTRHAIALVSLAMLWTAAPVSRCEAVEFECEDLAAPATVEIVDTACGAVTSEVSPSVLWQPVEASAEYLWEVVGSDGSVVDSGFTVLPEVEVGPLDAGTYVVRVQALGDGAVYCDSEWGESCTFTVEVEPQPAAFLWWPEQPKAGERIRFVDLFLDWVLSWIWDFGDGASSGQQHPTLIYDEPGQYTVIRDVELETGHVIEEKTITVAGVVECGNGDCESGETARSCPADCALPDEATGRSGVSDRRPTVPAVAGGGSQGQKSTTWTTEAWLHNPGAVAAMFVAEITASGDTAPSQAGPFTIEPGQTLFWSDVARDVFGSSGHGALSVDSNQPVLLRTRTSDSKAGYNATRRSGAVGQELTGIPERLTLAHGDGALYLLGLEQGAGHASWLHLHEVDGSSLSVEIGIFNNRGRRIRRVAFEYPSGSATSLAMTQLGLWRGSAYATVEVVGGDGRLAVSGSVVDLRTGDRITVPALHGSRTRSSKAGEIHQLVAVLLHRWGQFAARWRSGLAIVNPTDISQTVRLVYEGEFSRGGGHSGVRETVLTVGPKQQLVWNDVLPQLFRMRHRAGSQGSLHLFHSGDLLVDSRVRNLRRHGGAVGSNLPALGAGDMIGAGDTGLIIGLAHTPATRTSLGLSEFSGLPTDVRVALYATGGAPNLLGTREFSVQAFAHLGIDNLFGVFGLDENPNQPIAAKVTILRGGSVCPYAMTIDKKSGDPTMQLAARK